MLKVEVLAAWPRSWDISRSEKEVKERKSHRSVCGRFHSGA